MGPVAGVIYVARKNDYFLGRCHAPGPPPPPPYAGELRSMTPPPPHTNLVYVEDALRKDHHPLCVCVGGGGGNYSNYIYPFQQNIKHGTMTRSNNIQITVRNSNQ